MDYEKELQQVFTTKTKYFQYNSPLQCLHASGPVWSDSQSKFGEVHHLDDQAIDL